MTRPSRRRFLEHAALSTALFTISGTKASGRVLGANDTIQMSVVGFRGMGRGHINGYRAIPGVRVAALCDVDRDVLGSEVANFDKRGEKVEGHVDVRTLLENKNIDAVSTATPNHWHSLVTVWACQAGKDVCVEKPVSHNIFEGRKMVDAARKYNRVVQADLDMRSDEGVADAVRYVRGGNLGKILQARGFCYKRRTSIGKVDGPQKVSPSIDYNLWTGPAPLGPLMRRNLHYDWHWVWATGCGELGNNGPHQLDLCRWVLGQQGLPPRAMSIGGRFGYDDDAETPNTQIAVFDYQPAPILYEVRGLPTKTGEGNMDAYRAVSPRGTVLESASLGRGPNTGVVIECEGGWMDLTAPAAYDNDGKRIKDFRRNGKDNHYAHFIRAMRSRKIEDLRCDILQGHLSTSLCHIGNISHRIGQASGAEAIREVMQADKSHAEAFERFGAHLAANQIELDKTPAVLGPWVEIDRTTEKFTGPFAAAANRLHGRNYRKPFVVPEEV